MAIYPIICSFYYLARVLMHDVACEFVCAEGCAEIISTNALKCLFHGLLCFCFNTDSALLQVSEHLQWFLSIFYQYPGTDFQESVTCLFIRIFPGFLTCLGNFIARRRPLNRSVCLAAMMIKLLVQSNAIVLKCQKSPFGNVEFPSGNSKCLSRHQ